MYGHPREGALDLRNAWVLEKTLQIFRPSSPAEFVTAFSGRTDAPEVRYTHTHTTIQYILLNSPPSGSGSWPGLLQVLDY